MHCAHKMDGKTMALSNGSLKPSSSSSSSTISSTSSTTSSTTSLKSGGSKAKATANGGPAANGGTAAADAPSQRAASRVGGATADGHGGSQAGGWSQRGVNANGTNPAYTRGTSMVAPFLVLVCPFFAMVMVYTIVKLDGKISFLLEEIKESGMLVLFHRAWLPYMLGSVTAWKFIIPFSIFQLALMRILPGKITLGPVTPAGNVPRYKANGLLSFVVTVVCFFLAAYAKIFDPAEIYEHYLEIIGALNLVSLIFCLCLYFKGRFKPSSNDSGVSGNFLFDYFWGSELYPRIWGWDIKQFTNCRFGMMSWPLLILCFAAKQYEMQGLSNSMIVSVTLQLIYVAKFFHWEMGYMKTLDIMHDRAGFYLVSGDASFCMLKHKRINK